MDTPVVLIIFNRPDTTAQVFAEIAKAKPSTLLVAADGPRAGHPTDIERCAAARAVIERVDWHCKVLLNYSDVNLGCGRRPATGISWAFEQVEEAIILEDDCIPHPTFFRYCEELLQKYRHDERVMQICGTNAVQQHERTSSYIFSRHNPCWGWATWQRAWRYFDADIPLWPDLRNTQWLSYTLGSVRAAQYWQKVFDNVYECTNKHCWDYQWTLACWAQNGLSIWPARNLITNVGFGEDATHTKSMHNSRAYLPTAEMSFPLQEPPCMAPDGENDLLFMENILGRKETKYLQIRRHLSRVMPPSIRGFLRGISTKLAKA